MQQIDLSQELQVLFPTKNCSCHWPNPIFEDTLREFTAVRLAIHHLRRKATKETPIPYELFNRATILRHRLQYLAPCEDCIRIYNPTGRTKNVKLWSPSRQRAYKEALR